MTSASIIRFQIESALAQRIPSALTPAPRILRPVVETGITALDGVLHGGLPVGAISELVGPECSGRTSIALSFSHKPHKQQRSVHGWMCRMSSILLLLPLPVSILHGCYGCGVAYRKRVKSMGAAASFCQINALFLFLQRRVCMAEALEPIHAVRSKGSQMLSAVCCDQKQWLHDVRNRSIVSGHCGSHLRRSIRGFLTLYGGLRALQNHGSA
jgi:hypothetical protein